MCPLSDLHGGAAKASRHFGGGSVRREVTMRESSSRFGRLVACGAIVIGLAAVQSLLASQAEAVPGLQRSTKTSVSDSSTSKTVTAKCPAGKRVLGGGGTVTGGRGQVVLQRLEPVQTATDDRFVVGAREDGTGYSRTGGSPPTRCAPTRFRPTRSSPRRRAARARIPRRAPSPSVSANPRSDSGGASTAAPDRFT